MSRPAVSLAVVVGLTAAVVVVGEALPAPDPADQTRRTSVSVPIARTSAACPDPVADAAVRTRVSLAAPGPVDAHQTSQAGEARLTRLNGEALPGAALTTAGSTSLDVPTPATTLVASASGALAGGSVAAMVSRGSTGMLRGLAGTPCAEPGTDFWFMGSGSEVGQRGRVYLTNVTFAPAVADVTVYGPQGRVKAPAGEAVAVAAGAQKVLLLDALAPGRPYLSVHVAVRQGRLSAAVRDQQVDGLDPLGTDWVPPATRPARRLVLPGVPTGEGERRLLVLAPGRSDAIVRVRLLPLDRSPAPRVEDVIETPAGVLGEIDLTSYTGGREMAVVLTSDVPVTAGLLSRVGGGTQRRELAWTAPVPALTSAHPGVVADAWSSGPTHTLLALAAPRRAATVRVEPLPPATGDPAIVSVPRGTQATLDLRTVSTSETFAVRVVPLPRSGRVFATRTVTEADARGPMVTTSPVVPGRYVVSLPHVVADLSSGLPSRR